MCQWASQSGAASAVANWVARVVANGGATPSSATQAAMGTFWNALNSAGLISLMINVVCFVPDNLIAAITPFFFTIGLDPWTNVGGNFVPADLSINGLTGDGALKVLGSNITATNAFVNSGGAIASGTSGGFTVYNFTTGPNAIQIDMGANFNTGPQSLALSSIFNPGTNNTPLLDFVNHSTGRVSGIQVGWTGFTSGSRTSGSASAIYIANSLTPFKTLGTDVNNMAGTAFGVDSIAIFGYGAAGSFTASSSRTLSFAAVHFGLNSSQTQALFNAVQALRVALGGGFA
jgi:hypothetical protein